MRKKIWWLNPLVLYFILLIVVFVAFSISEEQYIQLYNTQKGINTQILIIFIASFLFFAVGYFASKRIKAKGHSFNRLNEKDTDHMSLYSAYRLLTAICLLAYLIWYLNFLRINGVSILSNFKSLSSISNVMYQLRDNKGSISGITTFTEIGIVSFPLGLYIYCKNKLPKKYNKRIIRNTILIILCATFRALAFSERLALIELLVPSAVVIVSCINNKRMKKIIAVLPIIGVVTLFIVFAAFEYSRSWLTHYVNYYDSYFEFILQRLAGYYVNAINTESLYVKYGSFSIIPYWSIEWLWSLPGMDSLYELIAPNNVSEAYSYILNTYGNPEYNNPGGLLALYSDFGVLFPFVQTIFGYIIGRFYRIYSEGNILGQISYSCIVLGIIELPRYFWFGSNRAFFVYIGLFILYYIVIKRNYQSRRMIGK